MLAIMPYQKHLKLLRPVGFYAFKLIGHARFNPTIKFMCTLQSNHPNLSKYLESKIKFSGPITVSEYMKEVLTNPISGYYMKKDVFGSKGDYVTSPEISQMFGELIAIWIYNEWYKMGAVKPFQLIELGPGTGSMMQDILRTLQQLNLGKDDFEIHMVEKSLFMSNLQEERLCGCLASGDSLRAPSDIQTEFKSRVSSGGHSIHWHYHLSNIPKGFSVVIAHEFFDALPIHKLKKTDDGWREVLVDINVNKSSQAEDDFRYVLSHGPTPASKMFVNPSELRKEVEVSPDGALIIEELSDRINQHGGAALIMDYGHDGALCDTFRAFKDHKQVSPFFQPGNCDLTSDVDFQYLRQHAQDVVLCYGPTNQGTFLRNMGIELRLQNLLKTCDQNTYRQLIGGYKMLVDPSQMGKRFKMMALFPKTMKEILIKHPVSGFFRSFEEVDQFEV